MTNEYGLDVSYFRGKLKLIARDIQRYTPNEMFNELTRLASATNREIPSLEEQQREFELLFRKHIVIDNFLLDKNNVYINKIVKTCFEAWKEIKGYV